MGRIGNLFGKFRSSRRDPRADEKSGGIGWVVAGLGNPEERYRRSRHNAGFMVVERIAAKAAVELSRRRFASLCAETRLDGETVLIAQPQTYYNRSGESLAAILGYFKVPIEHLVVVHDDLDLEFGQLQVRRGGKDAGNRGVRSIIEALGSPDFVRVRVGIGRPDSQGSIDYVLRPMSSEELAIFDKTVGRAAEAVEAIVTRGLERAMNVYNQRI